MYVGPAEVRTRGEIDTYFYAVQYIDTYLST